jgi:hypothetical protein
MLGVRLSDDSKRAIGDATNPAAPLSGIRLSRPLDRAATPVFNVLNCQVSF